MCDPITMGIVLAASTAASAYQQNQVAQKQDSSNAVAIQNEMNARDKANAALTSGIQQIAQSNPAAATKTNADAYSKAVQLAKEASLNNGSTANSTAFDAAKTAAGNRVSNYGDTLANFMAGIDAAGQQRVGEENVDANTRAQVGTINSDARAQNIADNARTASIRANPWLSALFAAGQGVGSAGMAGGLSAAAAATAKSAALSDLVNTYMKSRTSPQTTNTYNPFGTASAGQSSAGMV